METRQSVLRQTYIFCRLYHLISQSDLRPSWTVANVDSGLRWLQLLNWDRLRQWQCGLKTWPWSWSIRSESVSGVNRASVSQFLIFCVIGKPTNRLTLLTPHTSEQSKIPSKVHPQIWFQTEVALEKKKFLILTGTGSDLSGSDCEKKNLIWVTCSKIKVLFVSY